MALKPTIHKLKIELSDLNRNFYDTLHLTVACHPSETHERMVVRVLAFCMNAEERLSFTRGISAPDEPDIWERSLDGNLSLWIDVGEPGSSRIKKASRLASEVKVYSFNAKSSVWWKQGASEFSGLRASFFQFQWTGIQALGKMVQRTMDLSITITEDSVYVADEKGECVVEWCALQVV